MNNTSGGQDDEKAPEDPQDAANRTYKLQDAIFKHDADAERLLNEEKPWQNDPKFFKKCRVNAIAATKMLSHALAGVDEGRKKGGLPTEIMGLMVGKPVGDTIVIMDVVELPVEGSETQVVAASEEVLGYMTRAQEAVENRRDERFIGWYHSHPFDVGEYPNWFFSIVDISTQTQWQHMFGKWLGIVVDPLRSEKFHRLELGAFMVYPVNHTAPTNECPDGTIETNRERRVGRWGSGYNRYFSLPIEYFMGSLTSHTMSQFCAGQIWISQLSSSDGVDGEANENLPTKIAKNVTQKLVLAEQSIQQSGGSKGKGQPVKGSTPLGEATNSGRDLAFEITSGQTQQMIKNKLFNQ